MGDVKAETGLWPGFEMSLARDFERALSERGLRCTRPGTGGLLTGRITSLEMRTGRFGRAQEADLSSVTYRLESTMSVEVLNAGAVIWRSGPVYVQVGTSAWRDRDMEVGLVQDAEIRRAWSELSVEAARSAVQRVLTLF